MPKVIKKEVVTEIPTVNHVEVDEPVVRKYVQTGKQQVSKPIEKLYYNEKGEDLPRSIGTVTHKWDQSVPCPYTTEQIQLPELSDGVRPGSIKGGQQQSMTPQMPKQMPTAVPQEPVLFQTSYWGNTAQCFSQTVH